MVQKKKDLCLKIHNSNIPVQRISNIYWIYLILLTFSSFYETKLSLIKNQEKKYPFELNLAQNALH